MKSKKNLTRFTYKNAAFQGWRLCLSRHGVTFVRYFPDRRFGGGRKALAAAEAALASVKELLEGVGKGVDGKLPSAVAAEVERILNQAVPSDSSPATGMAPQSPGKSNARRGLSAKRGFSAERLRSSA